jgi:hypothetical protein
LSIAVAKSMAGLLLGLPCKMGALSRLAEATPA